MTRFPRLHWMLALAAAVLLTLPATTLAQGKRDRMLDAAVRGRTHERVPVIVTPRPGQSEAVETRLGKRGHKVDKRLGHGRAVVTWLDPEEIDALSGDPGIAGLSYDAPVSATAGPKPPKIKLPQLREMVAAVTGSGFGYGIGIAVIDSGIAPMPGLVERISAFYDFTGGTAVSRTPIDPYGHGTHVAGVAAGEFGAEMTGVASGARLVGLRVLDNKGNGSTSSVIDAVDFAVANRVALGIDIINLSLGHPVYEPAATDPLVQAVERAVRAGIVVVTSAGNLGMNPDTGEVGYGGVMSPGNAPSAITVGAANDAGTVIRSDDRVERFSSRGPSWFDGHAKPDLVAPGVGIISASAPGSLLGSKKELKVKEGKKTFLQLSGTSMAAPVVSGVAALVIKSNRNACGPTCPTLTPAAVKAILQYTATPLVDDSGIRTTRSRR
ncbi:MAG: S8 family peptidase, partial [Vicinamibacterales bacterium]